MKGHPGHRLPDPPVPSDCDLRDVPFPLDAMSKAFAREHGISVDEARAGFEAAMRSKGDA